MKKIHIILLAAFTLIAASCSQSGKSSRLEAEIEVTATDLPKALNNYMIWKTFSYDSNASQVLLTYDITRQEISPNAFGVTNDKQRKEMVRFLQKDSGRVMLELMDEAGAGLKVIYNFPHHNKIVEFAFTPDEIHQLQHELDERNSRYSDLEAMVERDKAICPDTLANGTILTEISLDSKYMVNELIIPDSVSMSTSADTQNFRNQAIEQLKRNERVLSMLRSTGFGIRYKMTVRGGSTVIVDIAPEEIQDME